MENRKMQMSSAYLQGEGHFLVQPRLDLLYFFITPAKHFAEIKWKQNNNNDRTFLHQLQTVRSANLNSNCPSKQDLKVTLSFFLIPDNVANSIEVVIRITSLWRGYYRKLYTGGGSAVPEICLGLNANEIQSPYNKQHKLFSLVKVTRTHTILSNMK